MTHRILLSGGGTAGSVTPLLALADELRRRPDDVEFRFIGTADGPERTLVEAAQIPFTAIAHGKWRRYWSGRNIADLVRVGRGYRQAGQIIRTWRPQVAVTAGSFVSVPVIWAAHRQGVPTLIHQQDVRPGLANRLMAPAADRITVAFKSTVRAFKPEKSRWIGNPVRPEILAGDPDQARRQFHLPPDRPVLLVLGGGTGSAAINSLTGRLAAKLVKHWSIIHLTGPNRATVEVEHPNYRSVPFMTRELPHVLAAADVVVSRTGLGSLSELAALSKAAIFIPLPASHQEANAAAVAAAEAGIVLDQRAGIESQLEQAIERLRADEPARRRLGQNLHQLYNPEALRQFADEVWQLIKP